MLIEADCAAMEYLKMKSESVADTLVALVVLTFSGFFLKVLK